MEQVTAYLNIIHQLLKPLISVGLASAIVLFIAKEVIDAIKSSKGKKNKLDAIKYLLSEEIKLNYWSLKKLFSAYRSLNKIHDGWPDATCRVRQNSFGQYLFETKSTQDSDIWGSDGLPAFTSVRFFELLPQLAELNMPLAQKAQSAYEIIAELEHYRQSFAIMVNNESGNEDFYDDMNVEFVREFATEEQDYFKEIEACYKSLCGKELKEFKLR